MNYASKLKSLLIKNGLSESEAEFYLYVLNNECCSVFDVFNNIEISKSTAYRAYESLKNLELISSAPDSWKSNLRALSLNGLIKILENKNRKQKKNISDLKLLNNIKSLAEPSDIPNIETFKGDEIYEKYHDLASMNYSTNLVYGSWEDFSHQVDLVSIEKQFVRNRLKRGGNSICFFTKDGPNTHEITDYDSDEDRKSKFISEEYIKPFWINAFEGNDYVYIWNLNSNKRNKATLIESKQVADFYKNFIYSKTV